MIGKLFLKKVNRKLCLSTSGPVADARYKWSSDHNNNNNNVDKICSAHISTLLGAQGANPETPGQVPSLS